VAAAAAAYRVICRVLLRTASRAKEPPGLLALQGRELNRNSAREYVAVNTHQGETGRRGKEQPRQPAGPSRGAVEGLTGRFRDETAFG
jgi:hypothetical protein